VQPTTPLIQELILLSFISFIGIIECCNVTFNDLWQFSHVLQYASSHTIHHETALSDIPFRSHELQSFSDLMIAFLFNNERTKWFPGNCLDHVSGFSSFSPNDTSRRHIGHLKPVDLSPFSDDVMYVWMHVSQNVWRHGKYFGTLSVSRHIVHVSRSSTVFSTLVEVAIFVLSLYFRVSDSQYICLFTVTYTSVFL
jgi:hypothetical protein